MQESIHHRMASQDVLKISHMCPLVFQLIMDFQSYCTLEPYLLQTTILDTNARKSYKT